MELERKTVMVTGGAGFIGSHLVDALIGENPKEIIVVDNLFLGKESNLSAARKRFPSLVFYKEDVADFEVMERIFKKHAVDVVFDLAVIPLPTSLVMPKECTDKNVLMVTTLCELQRLGRFKTLIHFSSSEVYGSAQQQPMDEKHAFGPSTPYAASKAAGDLVVLSYYHTFNIDCAIIRPFNNYGPRQNEGTYAGVIPITVKRILNNQPPIIQGDGKQTRDFIYVTDTAKAAIAIYKQGESRGKAINVGGGKEISIGFLIRKIAELMGYKREILNEPARIGDVRRHIAGIELAKRLIGFSQQVDFDEGIKKTVEWYKENARHSSSGM